MKQPEIPTHAISLAASVMSLGARLLLGGMFCFAAFKKLGDPQQFAFAIKGFKIIPVETAEPLIVVLAFVTPWTEMIAGLALIVGLWTRSAALVIATLLLAFIGALIHVIADPNIQASCSCFGDLSLVCGEEVGWCQVIRNVVLLGLIAVPLLLGGGKFSIDGLVTAAKESIHGPALGLGQGADQFDSDD